MYHCGLVVSLHGLPSDLLPLTRYDASAPYSLVCCVFFCFLSFSFLFCCCSCWICFSFCLSDLYVSYGKGWLLLLVSGYRMCPENLRQEQNRIQVSFCLQNGEEEDQLLAKIFDKHPHSFCSDEYSAAGWALLSLTSGGLMAAIILMMNMKGKPDSFIPAVLIGTIDLYHFVPLSVAFTLL